LPLARGQNGERFAGSESHVANGHADLAQAEVEGENPPAAAG
jgi:hypothetical protein